MIRRLIERISNKAYERGYRNAVLDIERLLGQYEDKDVHSIGIITLRSMLIDIFLDTER